ncbi:MAG: peptidoglycan-binding protein, partial [Proteobacteria bacterium]|nr:peptidoglycan-binding protein [Pseudomonadota bacterium]
RMAFALPGELSLAAPAFDDLLGVLERVTAFRASRAQVRDVQERLNVLGHDAGPVDGAFGRRTSGAISAYQRAKALPVDGGVTEDMIARLKTDVSPERLATYRASVASRIQSDPPENSAPVRPAQPQIQITPESERSVEEEADPDPIVAEKAQRPDPKRYSDIVWPFGWIRSGWRLSRMTEYGRLTCIGGNNSSGVPRECWWVRPEPEVAVAPPPPSAQDGIPEGSRWTASGKSHNGSRILATATRRGDTLKMVFDVDLRDVDMFGGQFPSRYTQSCTVSVADPVIECWPPRGPGLTPKAKIFGTFPRLTFQSHYATLSSQWLPGDIVLDFRPAPRLAGK